jgi:hypothetical protein
MVSQRLKMHGSDILYLQKTDPKNPPFCKIAFFCLTENDFFVSALNPALFLLSFSFCSLVNGQRVKVMDTLDKKMQTILEREDLYLNIYDDYRPRPVAVAPEPVKQDLIDNEILESVLYLQRSS